MLRDFSEIPETKEEFSEIVFWIKITNKTNLGEFIRV